MEKELGSGGNNFPDLLPRMAQFELTLLDWIEANKGCKNMQFSQTNAGRHFLRNSDLSLAM